MSLEVCDLKRLMEASMSSVCLKLSGPRPFSNLSFERDQAVSSYQLGRGKFQEASSKHMARQEKVEGENSY